ncbi:MATE family efflux transporter [Hathewaya limosa]|uniref:MATE family efflux protein n=1 Tax=Hathewaya limosa TaxID=1536 RepID=A0ABU0JPT5_HATLI|nr:MATE family efflux transporter [Hathewaya limosa]MDQ0479083.1 putative MATE family efflux protein [Hathewaya limosa]
MKKNIYEQKSVKELIFIFSMPAILSLIVETLTSVVDTAFAGHLGAQSANALTAMGLISPLLSIFTAMQTLFAISTAIMIARHLNNKIALNKYFLCGFIMTIFISIITSLGFYLFLNPVLSALGAEGQVLSLAEQYLKVQLLGNIFSAVGYTLTSCIRAFGNPKVEAIIISLAVIVNVFLNSIFTFGFSMGLRGISIGTLLTEMLCAGIAILWLCRKKLWFKKCSFKPREFIRIAFGMFKIGIAQTVIQILAGCTGFIVNNRLLNFGGTIYIAAWNVSQKLYILALMPIVGITQGVQTIISYFNGNKEEVKKSKTIKITILYCMLYGIVATCIIFLIGDKILFLFGSTSEIHSVATSVIKVIFITFPFVGVLYTIMTLLQVTDREIEAVILGLTRQVFSIVPLMILFPFIFSKMDIGITPAFSIFLAIPVADIISTVVALILFKKSKNN